MTSSFLTIYDNPQISDAGVRSRNGANPFRIWLVSLSDETKSRVQARLFRLEQGNLGDYKTVGQGVCELRITTGPGFRVYFGFAGKRIVILLGGGDKRFQARDILKARQNWIEYQQRGKHGSENR